MRALVGSLLLLAACSADRSGLGGPGGPDAGGIDAFVRDAAIPDAVTTSDMPAIDGGALDGGPVDSGPPDAGGCATGTADLDHDASNGCECVVGVETCNGVDDDCDGVVDGPGATGMTTVYQDADGDGHGNPSTSVTGCISPIGYVTSNDDCNDADAAIHPGAPDSCNGRDDDCNGIVDDGGCGGCMRASFGGHAYLFCDMDHSFNTSETTCAGFGYHLATVQDAGEDMWLCAAARGIHATGWWIGYTDIPTPYHWIAGASSYTGWRSGEPTGGSEHCALAAWGGPTAGSWNDGDCTHGFPFVCEVPP